MHRSIEEAKRIARQLPFSAQPVEPLKITSPWLTLPAGAVVAAQKAGGKSAYKGRAGSCTWLNGVYWVKIVDRRPDGLLTVENLGQIGKIKIPVYQHPVEPELIFPLLRGRDVSRWCATPSAHIVLPHNQTTGWRAVEPSVMKATAPNTYAYYKQFEKMLLRRAGYQQLRKGEPFYICANTGPWLFAENKVDWREQASEFSAAVVGAKKVAEEIKPVIPDHKLMLVELETAREAHYLCSALNSCVCRVAVKGYVVETQTSVHVLEHIAVPRFDSQNSLHQKLTELSEGAHDLVAQLAVHSDDEDAKRGLANTEDEIDRAAAKLWGLTDSELDEIHRVLELLR